MEHLGVLKNSLKLCVPDGIGIRSFWFLRRGESRSNRRKTSRSKGENQQQTQPTHVALTPGFEPARHCWKTSDLTTGPSLLPRKERKYSTLIMNRGILGFNEEDGF